VSQIPVHVIGLAPAIAIIMAFALPLVSIIVKNRRVWEAYAVTGSTIVLILASLVFYKAYFETNKPIVYMFGAWPPHIGIVYEIDKVNSLLGLLTASIMFLITIYSIKYLEEHHGVEWYYTLLLGVEAGMLGCFYTGDVFNLFVMLEVTSVAAYGLVAFFRSQKEAIEAALKYALVGSVATTMYFIALAFIYGAFGTLNMAFLSYITRAGWTIPGAQAVAKPLVGVDVNSALSAAIIALALSTWAFTVKAALFPNHFWLPDAHPAAPTPISALLSGLVVKVGVYAVLRFTYTIFGLPIRGFKPLTYETTQLLLDIILVLGVLSAIVASLLMVVQRDIKRLIAYSTVLHIGYIFMGMGLGTYLGAATSIFHTVNHAIAKALLFLAAGVFIHALKTRDIDELAGVGKKMPISTFCFIVAVLSLIGIPGFNGFASKWLLYSAVIEAGLVPLVIVIVFTSAMAALAYIKIIYAIWLKPPVRDISGLKEASPLMIVPLVLLAIACIVIGIFPYIFMDKVIFPATSSLYDVYSYVESGIRQFLSIVYSLARG